MRIRPHVIVRCAVGGLAQEDVTGIPDHLHQGVKITAVFQRMGILLHLSDNGLIPSRKTFDWCLRADHSFFLLAETARVHFPNLPAGIPALPAYHPIEKENLLRFNEGREVFSTPSLS